MKKGWEERSHIIYALIFLIIISFVLLTINNGNGKKTSVFKAVRVLNKGDVKTVGIQKKAIENKEPDKAAKAKIQESYGKLPMYFIANEGQVDKKNRFYEKGRGHATFFTKEGVYLSLTQSVIAATAKQSLNSKSENKTLSPIGEEGKGEGKAHSELVKLSFINANPDPEIIAIKQQEGKVNYFIGSDPKKWRTNIPTYQAVVYKEIYKGIDVKFYGSNRQMEYDIIVKPGADPSNIKFSYEGVKNLKVADSGDMEIILNSPFPAKGEPASSADRGKGEGAKLIQKKPYIYQQIKGKRIEVNGSFVISPSPLAEEPASSADRGSGEGKYSYAFQLASYNPNYPLIIDPILAYSTYLGGSGNDYGNGIAIDSSGNAYVTGYTDASNFPTTTGAYDTTANGLSDVFVTKLNSTGTALVYSTYLGGSSTDYGNGIAVDSSGNAYVIGNTISSNFPTTAGAYDTVPNGSYDAFLIKLNSTGTVLVYSTYLGGSSNDAINSIAVDSSENAYVTGYTNSSNFPTTTGAYNTVSNGSGDAFVTQLNSTGTALIYSTYLGGSNDDYGRSIAVDSSGNAYVTGYTNSSNFPTTTGAYSITCGGCSTYTDVFVTQLNSTGTALVYSTYLGGSGNDYGNGIAVDSSGNAHVTGNTISSNFPTTTGAYDTTANGLSDVFVTQLNSTGTALIYSTYLGGSNDDYGRSIAVDSSGNAYITGSTYSTNFPTANSFQGSNIGTEDIFVSKLNATGTAFVYSTYLGGSSIDYVNGMAIDSSGNAYVTGNTHSSDFTKTTGAYDTVIDNNSYNDAFVAKIGDVSGQYALAVVRTGTGTGTVTSNPVGINCGNDCYENYAANTVVSLTATPNTGYTFSGWSGDADCSDGVVTMNANKTCTATFNFTGGGGGGGGGGGCTQCQWCCQNTSTGSCESYFTDCCNADPNEMTNKHCNKNDSGSGGGCGGAVNDSKKDNQPPASGMVLLLLPVLSFISWLIYRRVRGVLWPNWRM